MMIMLLELAGELVEQLIKKLAKWILRKEFKKLDNFVNWIAHTGGYSNTPVNNKQYYERVAELKKKVGV